MTTAPATATATDVRPRREAGRLRLGRRAKRLVLLVHVAAAGIWLGMDVVLGLLVVAAFGAEEQTAAAAVVAIGRFAGWPLAATGLVTLASGLLLGLGTSYGLVRYWWVAVKLVLTLVLVTLVLVLLGPESARLADSGAAVLGGSGELPDLANLPFPPLVSSAAVLLAMTLSVFKPWGRLRGRSGNR